jgi:PAS domain-containing protein
VITQRISPKERALAASVEASPIATVLTNPRLPDNPVIAANHAFCALTGYPLPRLSAAIAASWPGRGPSPGRPNWCAMRSPR